MKRVIFPRDESAHNSAIEWWYMNSHLRDRHGNIFCIMNVLFKIDPKRVNLPFFEKLPYDKHYFAHSIISEIRTKKVYPMVNYFSPVSSDSFSKPDLFIQYQASVAHPDIHDSVIERTGKSDYHVKTPNFDICMKSTKKPLLENNTGYMEQKSRGGYYYSLTNLKTSGILNLDGKQFSVIGKSWMDHQWVEEGVDARYNPKYHWTWFSIQLDNNVELVCFEAGNRKEKICLATISFKDNSQRSAHDLVLTSRGAAWQSPATKAEYHLSWKIEVPSLGIELQVDPRIKEQEMLFGMINYWEGPLKVKGRLGQKQVTGQGFLEIVGSPVKISKIRLYSIEAKKKIRELSARFMDR